MSAISETSLDNNTTALLDRARLLVPRQSKGALALALGIDRANMNRIYKGKGYPNALQTARLARMLNMGAEEVAAMIAADKSRSRASAEDAKRSLPRVSPALSTALAFVAGLLTQAPGGSGKALAEPVALVSRGMHYAPRRRSARRWFARLITAVSRVAPTGQTASPADWHAPCPTVA